MKFAAASSMFITVVNCIEGALNQAVLPPQLSWIWLFLAGFVFVHLIVFILFYDVKIKDR